MTDQQKKRISDIYIQYHNVVKPMIVSLEIDDVEYPVEIINEIRAILNHVAKCIIIEQDSKNGSCDDIDDNIHDAERHLKRAIFDCYKYACISAEDYYESFCRRMKHVDLGVVDNGEYSLELCKLHTQAKCKLKSAKKRENEIAKHSDSNEVFELFQDAFVAYSEMREFIDSAMERTERVRHKQVLSWRISTGLAVLGGIGTVFTLLSYFGIVL